MKRMGLKLKGLKIHIETRDGKLYGTTIRFTEGLNIIRAETTTGKTTCISAIIYALGLEEMISRKFKFKPIVSEFVGDDKTYENTVIDSNVFLEIENDKGETITIKRLVISKDGKDNRLVSVFYGPVLSSNERENYLQDDFFVKDEGSAIRKKGFYNFLSNFIGWNLPKVMCYNGKECTLYMQCIFPLLIVDQKYGWSGIQSHLPTYFGIAEVNKRSIEFIMNLDISLNLKKIGFLKRAIFDLEKEWKSRRKTLNECLYPINGFIVNLPDSIDKWNKNDKPSIMIASKDKKISISEEIINSKNKLEPLEKEVPLVRDKVPEVSEELDFTILKLKKEEILLSRLYSDFQIEKTNYDDIIQRLNSLNEDLRYSQDIRRIKKYGSVIEWDTSKGECPTCHQKISDSLLGEDSLVMPIDENIYFIQSQVKAFENMKKNSEFSIKEKEVLLRYSNENVETLRAKIRALKKTLISDERAPSYSDIYDKIITEEKLNNLTKAKEIFEENILQFSEIYQKWDSLNKELDLVPKDGLSILDSEKLSYLQLLFKEQLITYHFGSFNPDSVEISRDNLKPIYENYFLEYRISASDTVRTIWSYLIGLLELSYKFLTNHLGIIIFDEPRQHGVKDRDLSELIKRAAKAYGHNKQVILFTSDAEQYLNTVLADIPEEHNYLTFEGRIIKQLDDRK
jgi:hypothetical protein